MTRRERHQAIVLNFCGYQGARGMTGDRDVHRVLEGMIRRRGFAIFTDEAVEELARDLLRERAFTRKLNAQNRARRVA